MKTESNPTSSARHEKPSNLPGANCSADALYPSLITAHLLAGAGQCRRRGTRRGNLSTNGKPVTSHSEGTTMHLGLALPFGDIRGDVGIVREFAEPTAAEGYDAR